jgi:hypothetical protein
MGLSHGDLVASCYGSGNANGFASYAKGYGAGNCDGRYQVGEFGTIMVGNYMVGISGGAGQVPLFSNPNVENSRCGVAGVCGNSGNGNAVRQMNEYRHFFNSHMSPKVETLSYKDQGFENCMVGSYSGTRVREMETINCSNSNIDSIEDIERFKFAQNIDLSNNNIVHVKALETLDGDDEDTWVTPVLLPDTFTYRTNEILLINLYGNDHAMCEELDSLAKKYPGSVIRPKSCFSIGAMVAILSTLLN